MHTTTSTFSHSADWRNDALQINTSNRIAVTKNANDANDTYWYPPVRLMLQANKPIAPNTYFRRSIYSPKYVHRFEAKKKRKKKTPTKITHQKSIDVMLKFKWIQ